jgi:uncharacterized integral membrane protein
MNLLWRWIKKLTFFLWLAFMALFGIGLAIKNGQAVTVSLFSFQFPELSLGLVIGLALLIGALLGFITNYLVMKPGQLVNERALKKATSELARLRERQTP